MRPKWPKNAFLWLWCPEISIFFCPENKNFVCPGLEEGIESAICVEPHLLMVWLNGNVVRHNQQMYSGSSRVGTEMGGVNTLWVCIVVFLLFDLDFWKTTNDYICALTFSKSTPTVVRFAEVNQVRARFENLKPSTSLICTRDVVNLALVIVLLNSKCWKTPAWSVNIEVGLYC